MTSTTDHTLIVKATDLKRNLYDSFMQLLQDEINGFSTDYEYIQMVLDWFQEEVDCIEKNGFAQAFRKGYTMKLLKSNDFNLVVKWFDNHKFSNKEELIICIDDYLGNHIELVQSVDLNY